MKLWLLMPIDERIPEGAFARSGADCTLAHVVRADDEDCARALAAQACADEGDKCWLDDSITTCVELKADGAAEVILSQRTG